MYQILSKSKNCMSKKNCVTLISETIESYVHIFCVIMAWTIQLWKKYNFLLEEKNAHSGNKTTKIYFTLAEKQHLKKTENSLKYYVVEQTDRFILRKMPFVEKQYISLTKQQKPILPSQKKNTYEYW